MKTNAPTKTLAKDPHGHVSGEEGRMAKKPFDGHQEMLAPSAIGEMQIKTTVRYPSAPITTARAKRRTKASAGEDTEKIGTLLGGRPVGTRDGTATPENGVAALQELKWRVTLWPGRPAQGLPKRNENLHPHENLHAHVDGSMSHKSQK